MAVDPSTASEANIESLTAVIARDPNNAESYNVRGAAYGRAGRYKEAIADFNTAIQIDPNFSRAYANRALVELRNRQVNEAFADYSRAIQVDPNYAAAYVGRGNIYRQQGKFDLALADYNMAIQLDSHRRAGLPQSRARLPGAGPAPDRDREFHHRDRPLADVGRAL